jgi:diguanylate cyclase (GGDEF)-like protein/PAS domain S-box-containing protein
MLELAAKLIELAAKRNQGTLMSPRKIIINKKDRVISLLWLFFVFLLIIQGILLYVQASSVDRGRQALAQLTASSIVMQVSTSLRSQSNLLRTVITHHIDNESISDPLAHKPLTQLDHYIKGLLSGYRGLLVFNAQGDLLQDFIAKDDQHIKQYSVDYFKENTAKVLSSGNFELSQSIKQKSVYFNLKFNHNQVDYYFSVIRDVNAYADKLIQNQFEGFELWLLDSQTNYVLAGHKHIYPFKGRQPIDQLLQNKVMTGIQSVPYTPWSVATIEEQGSLISEVQRLLPTYAFFTLIYIVLAVAFRIRIYLLRSKHGLNIKKVNKKNERSEQALACIDDVVITTAINGEIIYCNNSANNWLGAVDSIIGKPISDILPFKGMPWLDKGVMDDKTCSDHHYGAIEVDFNDSKTQLNISRHCSHSQDSELSIIWVLRDVTKESQDRELLDISRARYQALYNGCGVGMWHVDISLVRNWLSNTQGLSVADFIDSHPDEYENLHSSFSLIEINDAALRLHEYSSRADLIKNTMALFRKHNRNLMIEMTDLISKNINQFSLEAEFRTIEGVTRFYLVDVTMDIVGKNQALLSFIDITDRITAEKALKQSEQFWNHVLHSLPDTVYVNDIINKQTRYNSRDIGKLLGYTKKDLPHDKNWRVLLHPDDVCEMEEAVNKLKSMAPGEINETNARLKHSNGSWKTIRFRDCVFSETETDEAHYYVGTARDITEEEDSKIRLSYSERRYRLLAEGMSDMIFTIDKDYQVSYVSSSLKRMLGHSIHQVLREGLSVIFSTEAYRQLQECVKIGLGNTESNFEMKDKVQTLDLAAQTLYGLPVTLEAQVSILRDESGEVEGTLVTCRDVTQRRKIEREARTASEVFDNSSEAIMVTTSLGHISKVNKAFLSLTGFESSQIIGENPSQLLSPNIKIEVLNNISNAIIKEGYWQGEISYRNKQGEIRPSWTGITAIKDDLGHVQSNIIISSDIADKKITEARIEHLAYFDPLTGLPNRSQMHETLERFMEEEERMLALLFIDLDRFKPINDTMGHPVGDQVLKEVAQRLAASVRSQDLVARIGGDEFTVIMPSLANLEEAKEEVIKVSEMILHQMMQPFVIGDRQLYLSASVGVAIYPENASSGMDLLRNADTAMYHAKAMGKNNVQFYVEEMNIKAMERLELENNLHLALRRDEFELYFQAQWDIKENKLCGIETLLRWRRPNHGIVGPDKFIPIIEETGLIVPIGEWVLRAVCEQIIEWQETGYLVPKVAVNLSARQFKDTDMLDRICRIVNETGVDPELIELELTESILMDDVDRTLAVLNEARKMGFGLSIDDFGTGYSSLSYLKQFPVNNLKIDQSFIRNLPHNKEDGQITKTIVAMANNLGLGVIAEGVETQEQRQFLEEIGCHKVQGYIYSYPVPADAIAQDFLDVENEHYLEV